VACGRGLARRGRIHREIDLTMLAGMALVALAVVLLW